MAQVMQTLMPRWKTCAIMGLEDLRQNGEDLRYNGIHALDLMQFAESTPAYALLMLVMFLMFF